MGSGEDNRGQSEARLWSVRLETGERLRSGQICAAERCTLSSGLAQMFIHEVTLISSKLRDALHAVQAVESEDVGGRYVRVGC